MAAGPSNLDPFFPEYVTEALGEASQVVYENILDSYIGDHLGYVNRVGSTLWLTLREPFSTSGVSETARALCLDVESFRVMVAERDKQWASDTYMRLPEYDISDILKNEGNRAQLEIMASMAAVAFNPLEAHFYRNVEEDRLVFTQLGSDGRHRPRVLFPGIPRGRVKIGGRLDKQRRIRESFTYNLSELLTVYSYGHRLLP